MQRYYCTCRLAHSAVSNNASDQPEKQSQFSRMHTIGYILCVTTVGNRLPHAHSVGLTLFLSGFNIDNSAEDRPLTFGPLLKASPYGSQTSLKHS